MSFNSLKNKVTKGLFYYKSYIHIHTHTHTHTHIYIYIYIYIGPMKKCKNNKMNRFTSKLWSLDFYFILVCSTRVSAFIAVFRGIGNTSRA